MALFALDGNQGPPGDSHWQLSGSTTYYNAGNVGIGTASPSAPLQVVGPGVFGASNNTASGTRSFVGGGVNNTASGTDSFVGGQSNTASGGQSFIGGGLWNCAGGIRSFAGGNRAKVRPGSDPGSGACSGLPSYPGGNGDAGTFVWADNQNANFVSTGANQFLIRASGGVGIGTNSPQRDLSIRQRSSSASTYGLGIESISGNEWALYVEPAGNLNFRYNGEIKSRINASDGAYVQFSDADFKEDILPLGSVLDGVLQLQPVSYFMVGDGERTRRSIGFIAQEVESVFPELVQHFEGEGAGSEGHLGLSYDEITVLNTQALIELNQRYNGSIREKSERIASLEAENAELHDRLASLEQSHAEDLLALRAELAMLRELLAPALAGGQRSRLVR